VWCVMGRALLSVGAGEETEGFQHLDIMRDIL